MKRLLALFCAIVAASGHAATVRCVDTSYTHFTNALAQCVAGDTLEMGVGTNLWTTYVIVTIPITITGTNAAATVIQDGCTNSSGGRSGVIQFDTSSGATGLWRMSTFSIWGDPSQPVNPGFGCLQAIGSSKTVRFDHLIFENLHDRAIVVSTGSVLGVIDHCTFHMNGTQAIEIEHQQWGGGLYGDKSWSTPVDWGTTNLFYIESNVFTNSGMLALDAVAGARVCIRYNNFTNDYIASHGTDSSGRTRSVRAYEIYGNTINYPGGGFFTSFFLRGGSAVEFSNTVIGAIGSLGLGVDYKSTTPYWYGGGGNGTNTYGYTNNGTGLFASGTHNGSGSFTLVDTTANWTTNQWVGYTVQNPSLVNWNGWGVTAYGEVSSNSSKTMTFQSPAIGTNLWFNPGDTYQVYLIDEAIDSVGMGSGDQINPVDPPTPAVWPHQVIEPLYCWNNTLNGVLVNSQAAGGFGAAYGKGHIIEGKHYFNGTPKPSYTPLVFPHPLVQNPDPWIQVQPQNQSVTVGQTATFSVTASGQTALSYQWYKNGVSIPGATSASVSSGTTSLSNNNDQYYVVVSDSAGSVQSLTAILTVNPSSDFIINSVNLNVGSLRSP